MYIWYIYIYMIWMISFCRYVYQTSQMGERTEYIFCQSPGTKCPNHGATESARNCWSSCINNKTVLPFGNLTVCYWTWPLCSWFTCKRWWFSIVMLVYQRVDYSGVNQHRCGTYDYYGCLIFWVDIMWRSPYSTILCGLPFKQGDLLQRWVNKKNILSCGAMRRRSKRSRTMWEAKIEVCQERWVGILIWRSLPGLPTSLTHTPGPPSYVWWLMFTPRIL